MYDSVQNARRQHKSPASCVAPYVETCGDRDIAPRMKEPFYAKKLPKLVTRCSFEHMFSVFLCFLSCSLFY